MKETDSPLVLAIDAGTSSTRVLAFDFAGKTVGAIAQRAYAQTTTPDGGVFTDADALLELTAQCLDETLQSVGGAQVAAVSMSCFWHSLLGVGADDAPRTPLFSWADNRAAPLVETLRKKLDEDAAHARTGCLFHASFWPAKLLWLHKNQPELFDGETRWMSFGEYLALKWCGGARVSLSMASGTGFFNQNACGWDDETLSILPISRAALSPLCDAADALNAPLAPRARTREMQNAAGENHAALKTADAIIATETAASTRATPRGGADITIIATVFSERPSKEQRDHAPNAIIATAEDASTRETAQGASSSTFAATRWPQLQNAKWFPALGDGACSNVGSGCVEKRGGERTPIALNVGTSGALRVVLRDFSGAPPRGLFRYRLDAKRSVLGGALSNGGNVLMWARGNLALPQDVEARISAMPPDAHGLTVLPFLAGERSPDWNDAARFVLNGATLDTTPEEIYRAVLEGASLRFLRVLQLLQTALQNEDAASTRATDKEKATPETSATPRDEIGGAAARENPTTCESASFESALSPVKDATTETASTRAPDVSEEIEKSALHADAKVRDAASQNDDANLAKDAALNAASTRAETDFEIVASGGALSHSQTWAQIMADCLNAPLIESQENQASARGAALMALEALGAAEVADFPAERGETLTPDTAHHALYAKALQRQNALYEKLFGAT